MRPNRTGPTPSTSAAAIVARKHDVPDALSQFHSNTAAYGVGAATTGGTRWMMLCRPGTSRPFNSVALCGTLAGSRLFVNRVSAVLNGTMPHTRTNDTSRRYGSHATNTAPAEWGWVACVSGLSPSSRRMLGGVQNFITSTITTMHMSELAMSVSSGPTKLETRNCVPANDTPHATIAGSTSRARRPPTMTTTRY